MVIITFIMSNRPTGSSDVLSGLLKGIKNKNELIMKKSANEPRCYVCEKPLTNPTSIELGIGPVCRVKRKNQLHEYRNLNLFGNRADYSWGIDPEGCFLWLKSQSNEGRSLTNDIENALVEIHQVLPKGKFLVDYRIIYRDSESVWDAIQIVDMDAIDMDVQWLNHNTHRGKPYWAQHLKIQFFPVCEKDYHKAKEKLLKDTRYKHETKRIEHADN